MRRGSVQSFKCSKFSGALESPEGLWGALRALLALCHLFPRTYVLINPACSVLHRCFINNKTMPRVHRVEVHGGKQKTIYSTQDNKNYIKLLRIYKT